LSMKIQNKHKNNKILTVIEEKWISLEDWQTTKCASVDAQD
jgi:hypothetical protein